MRTNRISTRQLGLITGEQARDCGLSRYQIRHRVETGLWKQLHPKVFFVAGHPIGPRQRLLAATLQTGGVASHLSAAWAYGWVDQPPDRPHVTCVRSSNARAGSVHIHRSVWVERTALGVLPIATACRTLLDIAGKFRRGELERIVLQAVRHQNVTGQQLVNALNLSVHRARRGARLLQQVALSLLDQPGTESPLEDLMLTRVLAAGLPRPEIQYQAEGYRLDLAWPDRKVAIEVDGHAWHATPSQLDRDHRRQNRLELAGWIVLRFSWGRLMDEPDQVIEEIRSALASRAA